MEGPGRAVAEGHALDQHTFAFNRLIHHGAHSGLKGTENPLFQRNIFFGNIDEDLFHARLLVFPWPPGDTLAVEDPFSGEGDILAAIRIQEGGIVVDHGAAPLGQHDRQVIVGILTEADFRALFEVQFDAVLEEDGAGQPNSGGNDHTSAARCVGCGNCLRKGGGVERFTSLNATEGAQVEINRRNPRQLGESKREKYFGVISHQWFVSLFQ